MRNPPPTTSYRAMALLDILKRNKEKPSAPRRKPSADRTIAETHAHGRILSTNVARQFYITLQEPHRIWKPNEHIVGDTTLEIKKDVTNVAIRLALVSEIRVKARGSSPTTLLTKRTEQLLERSTFLYGFDMAKEQQQQDKKSKQAASSNDNITADSNIAPANSESVTEDDEKDEHNDLLCDEEGNVKIINGLTKGIHKFPFRIRLPKNNKNMFSSLKFERGSVNYYLQCTLEPLSPTQSAKNYVSKCRHDFDVIVPLDVSNMPVPKPKTVVLQSFSGAAMAHKKSNSSGDAGSSMFSKLTNKSSESSSSDKSKSRSPESSSDKTVSISVSLARSGYVMGEVIPVKIALEHYKPYYHAAGIITTLVRICRVGSTSDTEGNPIEKFRKDICQNVSPLYVDPDTLKAHVLVHLKVPPDAFATFNPPNQLFSFQYYIEVMVTLSRKNLVYTESNTILGGAMNEHDEEVYQNMTNRTKVNEIASSKLYGIEKNIQKKVSSLVNTAAPADDNRYEPDEGTTIDGVNERETKIRYKDMVNVEHLKGLRNVTGMSIEIVVGTVRGNLEPERLEPVSSVVTSNKSIKTSLEIPKTQSAITDSVPVPLPAATPDTAASELNAWLSNGAYINTTYQPAPEYSPRVMVTPDTSILPLDDKQELERMRLKALESEPPENY